MVSLTDCVLRHIAIGEHVQITSGGSSIAGDVRDINDHFIVVFQKDSLQVVFWKGVDSIRKTLKKAKAEEASK